MREYGRDIATVVVATLFWLTVLWPFFPGMERAFGWWAAPAGLALGAVAGALTDRLLDAAPRGARAVLSAVRSRLRRGAADGAQVDVARLLHEPKVRVVGPLAIPALRASIIEWMRPLQTRPRLELDLTVVVLAQEALERVVPEGMRRPAWCKVVHSEADLLREVSSAYLRARGAADEYNHIAETRQPTYDYLVAVVVFSPPLRTTADDMGRFVLGADANIKWQFQHIEVGGEGGPTIHVAEDGSLQVHVPRRDRKRPALRLPRGLRASTLSDFGARGALLHFCPPPAPPAAPPRPPAPLRVPAPGPDTEPAPKAAALDTADDKPRVPTPSAPPAAVPMPRRSEEAKADTAMPERPAINIDVLGGIRVAAAGRELPKPSRTKAVELLALLAAYRQGISTDSAAEFLLPKMRNAKRGTAYVRKLASELRSYFRESAGLPSGAEVVQHVNGRYRLDPALVDVDLWRFEDAVAKRDAVAACEAYRGRFAAAEGYAWALGIREAQSKEAVKRYVAAVEEQRATGDFDGATALAERGIEAEPQAEELYQLLMDLEWAAGRGPLAVRRTYELLQRRLAEESRKPSDESRARLSRGESA